MANGCKWEPEIDEFIRWSERYDLYCKMRFFGDAIAGGDRLYGYGGEYDEDGKLTREWVYDEANLIADDLGLDLYTLPEQVTEFQSPTRLLGSDSYYFAKEGIPYLYMEASLWCNDDGTGGNDETHLTCHYQTANEAFASTGGRHALRKRRP